MDTLRLNAEDTREFDGVWGVSAWAEDGLPAAELLTAVGDQVPHNRVRTTTVGRLQDGGFPVSASPPPHHVTIHLKGDPADDDNRELEALEALFDPPIVRSKLDPTGDTSD